MMTNKNCLLTQCGSSNCNTSSRNNKIKYLICTTYNSVKP